ncbi:MAG: hypothetical protein IJU95_02105, partial [Treponema sp.]|nr:hypothetical protein [Treponema sp.]
MPGHSLVLNGYLTREPMEFTAFTSGKDDAGKRLDRVLRALLDGSGINIFQALRKKLIKVNDSKAEASQRVNEGDCIQIASFLIPRAEGDISPLPDIPCKGQTLLEVIFRNDDLVFINKPAGISVQPSSAGGENISGIIKREWEAQGSHGSLSFTPAPLHRLDRYTSGLLAISASAKGADWFSKAMQAHEIKKTYIGICRGKLEKEELWQDRISACGKAGGKEFHKVKATSGTEEQ